MATEPKSSSVPDPRSEAGPARRGLHLLVAAAGWVLFSWWWILVLGRTSGAEVGFTLTFLALALTVIVLVTSVWVAHNVSLFRRKRPRRTVRERVIETERDTLGRGLSVVGHRGSLQESPIVRITVEGESKVYHPDDAGWNRVAAWGGGAAGSVS